jgi:recombinational DNA repair protein (RecF pathway)
MKCDRCGRTLKKADSYSHFGETLCEDCYLDIRLGVKGCDPWAVHSATRFRENSGIVGAEGLNKWQKEIYELVKNRGKATLKEVKEDLELSDQELQKHLATLRHCELIKGHKEGHTVYLIPFHQDESSNNSMA